MGQVKQQAMDEAENIINVTAAKLVGGDISEDDALEILDKNMDNLQIIGYENKYDAIHDIYETIERGAAWEIVQVNQDINFKLEVLNRKNTSTKNQ